MRLIQKTFALRNKNGKILGYLSKTRTSIGGQSLVHKTYRTRTGSIKKMTTSFGNMRSITKRVPGGYKTTSR